MRTAILTMILCAMTACAVEQQATGTATNDLITCDPNDSGCGGGSSRSLVAEHLGVSEQDLHIACTTGADLTICNVYLDDGAPGSLPQYVCWITWSTLGVRCAAAQPARTDGPVGASATAGGQGLLACDESGCDSAALFAAWTAAQAFSEAFGGGGATDCFVREGINSNLADCAVRGTNASCSVIYTSSGRITYQGCGSSD